MFRDSQDVLLARRVADACHQAYEVIPVGRDFLSRFAHYAERSVYLTDGCCSVAHAPDLYVNERAREIAPVRMTGNYGGEVLRLWEWPRPAVVLGVTGRIGDDVDTAACDRDSVPLARRSSGGGTVLLGRGCLLYTLVLRYDRAAELRDIRQSYQWILARVIDALPGVTVAGPSDLAIDGRKVGGSAQQRKRDHLLHHAAIKPLAQFEIYRVAARGELVARIGERHRHAVGHRARRSAE